MNGDAALILLVSGGLVVLLWTTLRHVELPRQARRVLPLLLLSVSLVGLALWAPHKHKLTDERIHGYGSKQRPIGRGWKALEGLPSGASIAWFGPGAYQYYPLFGRNYHLVPRPVAADGSPRMTEYKRW